jgi:hypothetical protein
MCINKNEGTEDRIIRGILALVAFLIAFYMTDGALQITLYFVFALFAMTAIVGYCGVYSLFGISTRHDSKPSEEKKEILAPVLKKEKTVLEEAEEVNSKPTVKKTAPQKKVVNKAKPKKKK